MKRFLNLGSGSSHIRQAGVEWVNIDKEWSHKPDLQVDYLELLFWDNFKPGTVDGIFSCHSIEHLVWPSGVSHFFEVTFQLLKPGGTLRLVVPDLMKVAKMYVRGESLKDIYGPDFPIVGPDCPATRFMAFCRGWEHTVLFDEPLLRQLSKAAGFVNQRTMPFGVSDVPELQGLDRFESESISYECDKPL